MQKLHESKPLVAFKRPKNLKDILVNSNIRSNNKNAKSSSKCNRSRCTHCSSIIESNIFSSTNIPGKNYHVNNNTDCSTKNVIYLVTCDKCKEQYVGQTKQQVSKRMNSHRFDINNFSDPLFSTNVATHFNKTNHCIKDFKFMPIEIVTDDMERLLQESYWIS